MTLPVPSRVSLPAPHRRKRAPQAGSARGWLRPLVATLFFAVLSLLGASYPLLARGDEILHARWSEPWFLLGLLLLPFVFYRAVLGEDRRTPRLRLGTLAPLVIGPSGIRVWLRDLPGIARTIGLSLCVLALARPLNTLRPVTTDEEGIDIVVALDMSGSMKAVLDNVPDDLRTYIPKRPRGLRSTRMDVAKAVLRDFISRRKSDRIGIVAFGSSAYVVSPPTLDYHLLDQLVAHMEINLIDPSATAIGDALGVSAARLRRSSARSKAIILLTDGDNKGGKLAPEYAAKLANNVGAHIYPVQIGSGEDAEVQDGVDLFGQARYARVNYPVNPQLLKTLASQTNGHMYIATDAKALQASFHDLLDKLEKTKLSASIAHYEDLYRFLLLPGVLLLAVDALLRALVLRRFPVRFAQSLWLLGAASALLLGVLLAFGGFLAQRALKRFGDPELVAALATARAGGRRAFKGVLLVLALGFAFVALAQPQYGRGTRLIPATDLDVVIVLDYSKSMYAKDITPSRIERAKAEVGRLIADMPGARFGAVAFAGETMAFPLTSDGAAIAQFLRQLSPNDMPVGGTAIARALTAGRELIARDPVSKDHRRVMLLVTDGEDLEGDPVEAAKAAAQEEVSIFVVQVGGRTPEPIPDVNELGQTTGFRMDAEGRPLTTSLSAAGEEQLAKVAETGGGLIARSEKGDTGIDSIAARLRRLMSEELSEKVETVYADVYAYPLALALLLLLIETAVPEAPAQKRATLVPLPPAKRRTRRKRVLGAANGLLSALVLASGVSGCERANDLFMRNAPAVDQAIEALDAGDAGAAVPLLEEYLSTGQCAGGSIGTPDSLRSRPNAAFDLGLGLFSIAERFGRRFGEDPPPSDAGPTPEEEAQLAKRSAEIDCALRIVRLVGPDPSLPIDLRARALFLAGNLEFLRRDYRAAVQSYDLALKLIPGLAEDAGVDGIGRDAAYNRAIALRRIEDQERDASPPDASPDGEPEQPDAGDDQPDSGDQPDAGDQNQDDQKDAGDVGKDAGQDGPPDAGNQPDAGNPPEPKPEPKPQPQANQDDRMLDELEQAPTLQQHEAKQLRGRVPSALEDK